MKEILQKFIWRIFYISQGFHMSTGYIAGFLPSTHLLWKKRQGSIDFFSTCKLRTYEQTGLEHATIDEA